MKAIFALTLLSLATAPAFAAEQKSADKLSCARGETYRQMQVLVGKNRELTLISMGQAYPADQAEEVGIRSSGLYQLCLKMVNDTNVITAAKRIR